MASYTSQTDPELKQWRTERKNMLPTFAVQLLFAVCLSVLVLYGGYHYISWIPQPEYAEFASKLAYSVQCSAYFTGALLFAAVLNVVIKRVSTFTAPLPAKREWMVQRQKNILTNTLEQTLLFFLLLLALTVYLHSTQMRIVPLYSGLFLVSRIMFMIGYSFDTNYRGFGMITNFISNMMVMGYLGYMSVGYWAVPVALFLYLLPMRVVGYAFFDL